MREIIETGKFCTVKFIKLDGTIRTINGRTGVTKYMKGGFERSEKSKKEYFLISTRAGSPKFDAYRHIRKDTILEIKTGGIVIYSNPASEYRHFIR